MAIVSSLTVSPIIRLATPTTATNFGGTADDGCLAVAINADGTELYVGGKYGVLRKMKPRAGNSAVTTEGIVIIRTWVSIHLLPHTRYTKAVSPHRRCRLDRSR